VLQSKAGAKKVRRRQSGTVACAAMAGEVRPTRQVIDTADAHYVLTVCLLFWKLTGYD